MQEVKAWKVGNELFENLEAAKDHELNKDLKHFFKECFDIDENLEWSSVLKIIKKDKEKLIEILSKE